MGPEWRRKAISCHCDNQTVTAALAARSSRNPSMMHLLRCLFFIKAVFEFNLTCITSQVLRIQRRMCCTGTTLLPFSLRCLGRTNTPHATGGSIIKSGTGLALDDLEGSLQLFFWQGRVHTPHPQHRNELFS